MAGSVNKVISEATSEPILKVRHTQDGRPIVNLRVATSENWRDKATGERRERTEWHRVVIFNENLAKIAEQYLKKGSKVYLEGQLQTRKWQDQSGRTATRPRWCCSNFARADLARQQAGGGGGDREPAGASAGDFGRSGPLGGRQPLLRQGARRRDPVLEPTKPGDLSATGLPTH
jgi:single-strand DNA-binding protein